MECPSCHSGNTQRLQMIHAAGTQSVFLSTSGAAGGWAGGGAAFGMGGTSSSGASTSTLANWAAPPSKRRTFLPVALTIFFLLLFFMHLTMTTSLFAIVPGIWAFRNIRYNLNELPHLRENWLQKWMCLTCGHEFIPEAPAATQQAIKSPA